MTFLVTIIAFIIALGILIVFHEFGHYIVARWCGVRVLRFSIGFGRPLFRKRLGADKTEWVIAAFPLGGYVKMLDEQEGKVPPEDLARAFNRKPVANRFAIVAAGPLANFLLAILLYWILFMSGVSGMKPVLGPVVPATPAAFASFHEGETITQIENEAVTSWQDVRWLLLAQAVDRAPSVGVHTVGPTGETALRRLDLSHMEGSDLEGDFLARIGLNNYQPPMDPVVGMLVAGGAGERGGLQVGDEILAVNGKKIALWEDLVVEVRKSPGKPLELEILRGGATSELKIVPDAAAENGDKVGKLGIGPQIDQGELDKLLVTVRYPPLAAMAKAIRKTWETSLFTLQMLWKMVAGEVSWKNISGPITIADYAGKSAQLGLASYIAFLALISISLGVLNLLPVPLLDGGHLMYFLIEILKGSPLSVKATEIGQQVGMALLFALMVCAIYNDVARFIPS
jgi:regulator of sigma E protease